MAVLNLACILKNSAAKYPNRDALVIDGDTTMSYSELHAISGRFAAALDDLAIGPRAKIALMIPNVPQYSMAYFGSLYRGSAVVPINVLLKRNEVAYHIEQSDAEVLVVYETFLPEAKAGFEMSDGCKYLIVVPKDGTNTETYADAAGGAVLNCNTLLSSSNIFPLTELAPTNPDDTAVILYTSGTTGKPKGAELSHFNVFQNVQYIGGRMAPLTKDDVTLAALPLFHSFCQNVVHNNTLAVGGTVVLLSRFDPTRALELMQKHRVTFFAGVPTMYFALLNHPQADKYDLSSLRLCVSGGSAMPVEVMKSFDVKYGVNILEGYGLSETSPVASFNMLDRPKKVGSIGVPIDYVDFKLVDEKGGTVMAANTAGEIHIKGVNVMKGYYKNPEATADVMDDNGYFATGDIAYRDEDGYYFIVDRKKDMLIRGGLNVYPREVEEVLYKHEAVAEAAVIGVYDAKYGQEVKAVIALKSDKRDSGVTAKEIITFCKSQLAAYKYPRIVEFMDSLPKGPTGKILKRELRREKPSQQ